MKSTKKDLVNKQFSITSLCREDLESLGFDSRKVDDATMKALAERLGDEARDSVFSHFESVAKHFRIPKRPETQKERNVRITQETLENAHFDELVRNNANAWNLGWYSGPTRIESKTDKGILVSTIKSRTRKVSHGWYHRPKPR